MKTVKRILLGLLGLVVLALVAALFVPRAYRIERSVHIAAPRTQVFAYLQYMKNQDQYSKWVMADPAMKKTFAGTDGTVGFRYSWASNRSEVGAGEQTITTLVPGEQIGHSIHFIKPFEGHADVRFTTEEAAGGTRVTWSFASRMPYPFNLLRLVMNIDGTLGGDMEQSLRNLKQNMEKH